MRGVLVAVSVTTCTARAEEPPEDPAVVAARGHFQAGQAYSLSGANPVGLYVAAAKGGGAFEAPQKRHDARHPLAAADLNGDGALDLVTGRAPGCCDFLLQAGGQFVVSSPALDQSQNFATTIAVGDWNADGKVDLAVTIGMIRIFLGDGAGGFNALAQYGGDVGHLLAAGDFDGDGRTDLVSMKSTALNFWMARVDGTFGGQSGVLPSMLILDNEDPFVGDLDGDGRADLLVQLRSPDFSDWGGIAVYQGRTGGLPRPVAIYRSPLPRGGAVARIDGDERPDVALPLTIRNEVLVIRNDSP